MSFPLKRRQKRQRQKSSPHQKCISKKHKTLNDSDTDFSYTDIEDSDLENVILSPTPTSKMAADKLSKSDLKEIAKIIAKEIKDDLIKDIKSEIKIIIQKETADLKSQLETVKSENKQLKSNLNKTALQLDDLEQYGRRM